MVLIRARTREGLVAMFGGMGGVYMIRGLSHTAIQACVGQIVRL